MITGTLRARTRDEVKEQLEALGAKVSGSVSAKTSALIAGEEAGSKLDKARDKGGPVFDEAALDPNVNIDSIGVYGFSDDDVSSAGVWGDTFQGVGVAGTGDWGMLGVGTVGMIVVLPSE